MLTNCSISGTMHAMETTAPPVEVKPEFVPLTDAEKAALRDRILKGERLDLETCKRIVATQRMGRVAAAEAAAAGKGKRKSTKKGMTDDELDADLDKFLGGSGAASAGTDSTADSEL